jgi:hypothetical protein
MPEEHNADEPILLLMSGTDELYLDEDGKTYRPGDRMPRTLSHARRVALQAAGIRFETRHDEPVITPEGRPAEMAAAEQIDPPQGAPAVVAAVEDRPKTGADEPAPPRTDRATTRKGG